MAGAGKRIIALGFPLLMLALAGLCIALGFWQLERLGEKQGLIARVAQRASLPPEPLPGPSDWPGLDPSALDFRQVTLTGTLHPEHTVPVFTSLPADGAGEGGAGYWLMVPMALEGGGTVFVNRGFVPQDRLPEFRNDAATPPGPITVTGVARQPERSGSFTPDTDREGGIEWVRDPQRLASLIDPGLAPIAPVYVDLPADPAGALPRAGETIMSFPNRHLEYALTWFAFAGVIPIMLVFWYRQQARTS